MQLGACLEGIRCAIDDDMSLSYALAGVCPATREAYIEHQIKASGETNITMSGMLSIAERVRAAIQARNANAFLRPRG